jgi:hypothetical protein
MVDYEARIFILCNNPVFTAHFKICSPAEGLIIWVHKDEYTRHSALKG